MKCYKIVLKLKDLPKNYGSCIVGSVIALYFFDIFIFFIVSFENIKKEIYKIIFALRSTANPIKKKKEKIKKKIKKKYLKKNNFKNNDDKTIKQLSLILENTN